MNHPLVAPHTMEEHYKKREWKAQCLDGLGIELCHEIAIIGLIGYTNVLQK